MENFDIGILEYSYNTKGDLLNSITIIRDGSLAVYEKSIIGRKTLIELIKSGKKIMLTRYLPIRSFNQFFENCPYAPLTVVYLRNISGKVFIKATSDLSLCDDLG